MEGEERGVAGDSRPPKGKPPASRRRSVNARSDASRLPPDEEAFLNSPIKSGQCQQVLG